VHIISVSLVASNYEESAAPFVLLTCGTCFLLGRPILSISKTMDLLSSKDYGPMRKEEGGGTDGQS